MERDDFVMPRTKDGSVYELSSGDSPDPQVVTVDRARFERLREFAAAAIAYSVARADALSENDFLDHLERIRRARVALLPADADPLP